MDVSAEQISLYVDGQLPPEQAVIVEEALRADPALAALADELRGLGELFGEVEPEEISPGLRRELYALEAVEPLGSFEVVPVESVRRTPWLSWAAAAAAIIVLAFGLQTLSFRPEVSLREFTRMSLGADGVVVDTSRYEGTLTMRAGRSIRAGENERVSFRLPDGSRVVLLPSGLLNVGDPRQRTLIELERGTVLCSVTEGAHKRSVLAGGYRILSDRADFGVRLEGRPVSAAGFPVGGLLASGASTFRLTVSVSRGEIEVGEIEVGDNGNRETVRACERVVIEPDSEPQRFDARGGPLYVDLMGSFRAFALELLPSYFDSERGVTYIPQRKWQRRREGGFQMVVTDDGAAAAAGYLVVSARAPQPTPLQLTLTRPLAREPGPDRESAAEEIAEEIVVSLGVAGREWTMLWVPMAVFKGERFTGEETRQEGTQGEATPGVVRKSRKIPADESLFARLTLSAVDSRIPFELKGSLWAARPPTEAPGKSAEVTR